MGKIKLARTEMATFGCILLGIVVVWATAWFFINYFITDSTNTIEAALRGQFGDQFGAVNALFSGCAFAGIIFTILLQRSDLIETREAMSHERFDSTFFQLLNLHMSITEKIETLGGSGKEAFVSFHGVLKSKDVDFYAFTALSKLSRDNIRQIIDSKIVNKDLYSQLIDADVNNIQTALGRGVKSLENFLDNNLAMHEGKIVAAYSAAAEATIDDFAHYFRNLYNILKFIDEAAHISDDERCRYAKFIRSQLSEAELIVLFYNSIAEIKLPGREKLELGFPKMSKLLVKYDVLHNMNPRSLIHPSHKEIFEKNTPKLGGKNAS